MWLRERDAVVFVRDAHNLYLETLAELGPLGLALLLVALGAPLLAARKAAGDPAGRAALAAYVALLAHAALDWDWELPAVTLCTVFLAVALVRLGALGSDARLGRPRWRACSAQRSPSALSRSWRTSATARWRRPTRRSAGTISPLPVGHPIGRAFAPWSAEPWRLLGQVALAEGQPELARRRLRQAAEEDPRSWDTWFDLALATSGPERLRALAHARRLNPPAPELDVIAAG